MSCEHVEELLSAYLDNALTPQERVVVQEHTSTCSTCRETLADYRRFDVLLSDLPHVSPGAELRDKIFASPEYLELIGTTGITSLYDFRRTRSTSQELPDATQLEAFTPIKSLQTGQRLTLPQKQTGRHSQERPHLVALPGGLQETKPNIPAQRQQHARGHSRTTTGLRAMQIAIAACLLLTLGVGSFIGLNLWQQNNTATLPGGITPPLGARLGGPLPAGTRYVFFHNGALWSGSTDTTNSTTNVLARLTSTSIIVSQQWSIRPAFSGHVAGNMLAYIDQKQGRVHIIRSDGQSDKAIAQPLFANSNSLISMWKTPTGTSILDSLAWSPDGSMLAFIAAPTGVAHLYIYHLDTARIQMMSTGMPGDIQSLNWSSDTANTHTSVLTWSVGTLGHIHEIMQQQMNTGTTQAQAKVLLTGDYVQARYNHVDSWLLLSQNHNIFTLNLSGALHRWTSDGSANFIQWSPKNTYIGYVSNLNTATSTYHAISLATGSNIQIGSSLDAHVAPAWSSDEQTLLYTDGATITVTNLNHTSIAAIRLPGATLLTWNPANPHQALVELQSSKSGLYLYDTVHKTLSLVSKTGTDGSILWTEIS